jgi:hypothetical protein
VKITPDFSTVLELSYVLGPLGLLLVVWVWLRLRRTRHRDMAGLLLTIVLLYAIVVAAAMYVSAGNNIPFDERYYRYAGILFFLLLLTAIDQWRQPLAKSLACVVVIALGLYGLKIFVTSVYAQMRTGYYDPITGISQDMVSPTILEYLRSEVTRYHLQRPLALISSPAALISLPRFRILHASGGGWARNIDGKRWAGRAEKIFVVVPDRMVLNGEAEAMLHAFTDYDFDNWKHTGLDGMMIYTQ